jgi:hypothetical protein
MSKKTKKPVDPVIIRVWKSNPNDVFALFPTLPADVLGYLCTSYQHVGQHSSANYDFCIRKSRPASTGEARKLLAELRQIGYRPRVYRRRTPAMRSECQRLARQYEESYL